MQFDLFEKTVESTLQAPVFVTQYPAEVSPLARCNDEDPFVTDRFELFVGGRELAYSVCMGVMLLMAAGAFLLAGPEYRAKRPTDGAAEPDPASAVTGHA